MGRTARTQAQEEGRVHGNANDCLTRILGSIEKNGVTPETKSQFSVCHRHKVGRVTLQGELVERY